MPIKSSARILIVEPDFAIAQSLTVLLLKHGFYVEHAHTPTEAVNMAINSRPNLLIIEPHLTGEMQGVDVANTILSFSPTTEIIFLSTWKSEEVNRVIIKKPCEFLSKPYDDGEMIQAVKNCLATIQSKSSDQQLFY